MLSKQALGSTLWGMADILRDKVEDYKSYILTLLFFKRLSDNYTVETARVLEKFRQDYGKKPNAQQYQTILDKAHDYTIPDGCFWNDVRSAVPTTMNDALAKAVETIAEKNPRLKGIINTVRWNEPAPDGSGNKKLASDTLITLVSYLDAVNLSDDNASPDVLGDAYEYLIGKFADENKGGATAGQFYTPQEVVRLITRYLKPAEGDDVYDPTCGSGSFLIHAAKFVKERGGEARRLQLHGQETVWNTWAICNINMILHNLEATIEQGDTLKSPKFLDGKDLKTFDVVMANFPFSLDNWWSNGKPKKDKQGKSTAKNDGSAQLHYPDKTSFADPFNRFLYGIPPFSNGDFAFLQHIVTSMNEQGRAGVVCPQGVLFRGQPAKTEEEDGQNRKADDEWHIRKQFITGLENAIGNVKTPKMLMEAIVVLPAKLFYGTGIPGAILFLNNNKRPERADKILMVYAARDGWCKEDSAMNRLLPHDVMRIAALLESWGDPAVLEQFLPPEIERLRADIADDLAFRRSEIEQDYADRLSKLQTQIHALREEMDEAAKTSKNAKPTKKAAELAKREQQRTDLLAKKDAELANAEQQAQGERNAIASVAEELRRVLRSPQERKRYFAIVDNNELADNDYNLNIPRYVDTFEPEETIDLQEAIKNVEAALHLELSRTNELTHLLSSVIQ
ncbi:MAG: N-6 DNA methylase [Candidatus Kapaibacterium sp.]|nr:MAG: N-6 DNA methylase [Candidatus Kapabacteria bacterium]